MRRAIVSVFALVAVWRRSRFGMRQRLFGAQTSTPPPTGQGFVGTWPGLPRSSPATRRAFRLATWFSDGTINHLRPAITPAPAGAPNKYVFNSMAQGTWYATGDNTATATFSWLRSDENGTYLGMTTIRLNSTLSADGQSFHMSRKSSSPMRPERWSPRSRPAVTALG